MKGRYGPNNLGHDLVRVAAGRRKILLYSEGFVETVSTAISYRRPLNLNSGSAWRAWDIFAQYARLPNAKIDRKQLPSGLHGWIDLGSLRHIRSVLQMGKSNTYWFKSNPADVWTRILNLLEYVSARQLNPVDNQFKDILMCI